MVEHELKALANVIRVFRTVIYCRDRGKVCDLLELISRSLHRDSGDSEAWRRRRWRRRVASVAKNPLTGDKRRCRGAEVRVVS